MKPFMKYTFMNKYTSNLNKTSLQIISSSWIDKMLYSKAEKSLTKNHFVLEPHERRPSSSFVRRRLRWKQRRHRH